MAFVFNFSHYISWPETVFPDPDTPFTICLDATAEQLTIMELTVQGEAVANRPYAIKELSDYSLLKTCQILFVSAKRYNEKFNIPENLRSKILYVSDAEDFALQNGMIELKQYGQRLKLLVNLSLVKSTELRFKSSLMKLMTVVK